MKKIIQINTVCYGSTGKVMKNIQKNAEEKGFKTLSIYGRGKGYNDLNCIKIGGFFSFWLHVILSTVFDSQGYHGSYFKTKKIVKILKKENPDVIYLHNIHGYYLNYPVLFNFLKNDYNGKIYWVFHDCWPFTGHCAYFTLKKCKRWKKECHNCPNKKVYPISLIFDNSKKNYLRKKEIFNSLTNVTIITPSDWLNHLVKKSFLKKYDVKTINNTIDESIFQSKKNDEILQKYNIDKSKKIVLGVANIWEERKGLNDFIKIATKLPNDYQVVLVGISKRQKKKVPNNIICISRTENQNDLAVLYSSAYVFVNPTYEDNYPTVNLEAIACKTKVICYDTGGCKEQIINGKGFIVPVGNINKLIKGIIE
ncbi:MAG: glycosyltransferase [Firmicutes bacterium]|nr:glycosyltransferase [Bacillota bacterium]